MRSLQALECAMFSKCWCAKLVSDKGTHNQGLVPIQLLHNFSFLSQLVRLQA